MNQLVHIDQEWLVAINNCHAPWADNLMWIISMPWTWVPLYALLIGLLFWRCGWKKALVMVVAVVAAAGLSDWISSGVIKHAVCRLRPTHEPTLEGMIHIVRNYTGGLYGFVSSHAANTMAVAMTFSLIWRKWQATVPLMLWVALNCYSRMYLGVHYPGDILGGLIVGTIVSLIIYIPINRFTNLPIPPSTHAC